MKSILLLGAGKIGETIATMLLGSGDYRITVGDRDPKILSRLTGKLPVGASEVDASDPASLAAVLKDKFAVISALPYHFNPVVAQAAVDAGVHYFDLTEDVNSTRAIKKIAQGAPTLLIPQSGLAPGFISIVAYDLCKRFDSLHSVHMRVGALPKYPSNALKYTLTWSTEGLINEYCNPCEAVVDGELKEVPPLEELERFALDGVDYEAFNTSGGLGTLAETLAGKVKFLNYRTVRYPGHRDLMKVLLQDLRLAYHRDLMAEILERAIPMTYQDVVLIFVTVTGTKDGRLVQESYAQKVYAREMDGHSWSAIQITTSAGVCAVLDMVADGSITGQGLLRQEDIRLDAFLANRFGQHYRKD